MKTYFIKSSRSESRVLSETAQFLIKYKKDIAKMEELELEKIVENQNVVDYIMEFLRSGKSKNLKDLESRAYDSVYRYITEKQQNI